MAKTVRIPKLIFTANKRDRISAPTEYQECFTFTQWLELKQVLYFHIPNEGLRTISSGARLKKIGLKKGVPDYFICSGMGGYHGLFIEMKRKTHCVITPHQEYWLERLVEAGFYACVCRGAEEAINTTCEYLAGRYIHESQQEAYTDD